MFGLVYLGFMFVTTLSSSVIACKNNIESKKWWMELPREDNPDMIYCDRKGIKRELETNKAVEFLYSYRTGDKYKKVIDDNLVINLSDKWRKEHFKIAQTMENEYSVFPDICILHNHPNNITENEDHTWKTQWYASGQWWKDLKNEKLYCIRTIDGCTKEKRYVFDCYLDIETGLLVRPADGHNYNKVSSEACNEIIATYNNKKKHMKKPSNMLEWNMFYENTRIAKLTGYSHLSSILREMKREGCQPSTI